MIGVQEVVGAGVETVGRPLVDVDDEQYTADRRRVSYDTRRSTAARRRHTARCITQLAASSHALDWHHLLVHGQVTIIFVVSVCLFVCLFVQSFLSRL